jgi:hypothetical protein
MDMELRLWYIAVAGTLGNQPNPFEVLQNGNDIALAVLRLYIPASLAEFVHVGLPDRLSCSFKNMDVFESLFWYCWLDMALGIRGSK